MEDHLCSDCSDCVSQHISNLPGEQAYFTGDEIIQSSQKLKKKKKKMLSAV